MVQDDTEAQATAAVYNPPTDRRMMNNTCTTTSLSIAFSLSINLNLNQRLEFGLLHLAVGRPRSAAS